MLRTAVYFATAMRLILALLTQLSVTAAVPRFILGFRTWRGYSPRFVERVLQEYLPKAKRILEPFAGSGTTPIVLGQDCVECAYSEANPAMAFIVQTKLEILAMRQRKQAKAGGQGFCDQ